MESWKVVQGGLLAGALLLSVGCAHNTTATTNIQTDETSVTELPPLVTEDETTSVETTTEVTEETTEAETVEYSPELTADVLHWNLPKSVTTVQSVRYYDNKIYFIGTSETDRGEVRSIYSCEISENPEFTLLFDGTDDDNEMLTDFDILSDGTICGLVCENEAGVPQNTEDADFDWESYYEENNTSMSYKLVWYNRDGSVDHRMGLTSLYQEGEEISFLTLDCDGQDMLYLTANAEEESYLFVLDRRGNRCTFQGSNKQWMELPASYELEKSNSGNMSLLEKNLLEDGTESDVLYSLVATDNMLWKISNATVEVPTPYHLTSIYDDSEPDMIFASAEGTFEQRSDNNTVSMLYSWEALGIDETTVDSVLYLPDSQIVLTTIESNGDSLLIYLKPEGYEIPTEEPEEETDVTTPKQPPVATPVTAYVE